MEQNLLIVGAGIYGMVASEIAADMGCFKRIAFVDDQREAAPNGERAVGKTSDLAALAQSFTHVVVAIGNSDAKLALLKRLEGETNLQIVTLVSPKAHVAPSAWLGKGCILEPMAVVHTASVLGSGCIVSAGAVVNHGSLCCPGVHVDCNATIPGFTIVPTGTKVNAGTVFQRDAVRHEELLATSKPHTPMEVDGLGYRFEDGM